MRLVDVRDTVSHKLLPVDIANVSVGDGSIRPRRQQQ